MTEQAVTMESAMEQAAVEVDAKAAAAEKADVSRGTDKAPAEGAPATPDEWKDQPGWAKHWKEPARNALRAYATHPELGAQAKPLLDQLNEFHTYLGRQNQALSQYSKRFDSVSDLLAQAEHTYTRQGGTLQQGLAQLFTVSQDLARDPDSTLPWLGSLYKPQDPAKAIVAMAKQWGVDLGNAAQSQPYVDPAIQQMVNPLLGKVQQLEQQLSQRQQMEVHQQQNMALQAIRSFEESADAGGKPKYPYFRDVFPGMIYAMDSGQAPRNLEAAYQWAVQYHQPAIADRAKAAEQAALQQAAQTSGVSNHAKQASNNLNGTAARGRPQAEKMSMDEAMRMADAQLARKYG